MNWEIKAKIRKLGGMVDIGEIETLRLRVSGNEIEDIDGNTYPLKNAILDYEKGYIYNNYRLIDWVKPIPLPIDNLEGDGKFIYSLSYNLIRPAIRKVLLIEVGENSEAMIKTESGKEWIRVSESTEIDLPRRFGYIYVMVNGTINLHTRPISIGR